MSDTYIQYLRCLFTCCGLLIFVVVLHDVEASSCQREIHKRVGDTVELSTCLPSEGITAAQWRFGGSLITNFKNTFDKKPFEGRLDINQKNFNLIIKDLTLQDSGEFIFQSGVNGQQRGPTVISLKVHESVAKPDITGNSTWDSLDDLCRVVLDCGSISATSVSYKWTVRNQTISSSLLRYELREEDGETTFTCTISNPASETSTSKTVKCTRDNQEITKEEQNVSSSAIWLIIGIIIGLSLILLPQVVLLCYKKSKAQRSNMHNQPQTADKDESPQHVYSSLLHGDTGVYETVEGTQTTGTGP